MDCSGIPNVNSCTVCLVVLVLQAGGEWKCDTRGNNISRVWGMFIKVVTFDLITSCFINEQCGKQNKLKCPESCYFYDTPSLYKIYIPFPFNFNPNVSEKPLIDIIRILHAHGCIVTRFLLKSAASLKHIQSPSRHGKKSS